MSGVVGVFFGWFRTVTRVGGVQKLLPDTSRTNTSSV
jgi:hypothetical protein